MAIGATTAVSRNDVSRRARYEQIRAELMVERASFESHWRELGDYLMPRRTRFFTTDRNRGDRRNANIIDSTPRFAARTLQSGLHAGLTSPARPWMRLTTPDPDLAEFAPVKEWLHTVTQRMLTIFLRSNLYNALPVLYGDLGIFGTAAMGVLEDDEDLIRAYTYPIGSYAVGMDARGLVTTFIRDSVMTVRQLVEAFGPVAGDARMIDWSKFSSNVKNLWDRGSYEQPINITWIVTPNRDANPNRLRASESMPWQSCHFETGQEKENAFLKESGFRNFPVLVPRWDVTGEDSYGTDSPGMICLGDVKALQVMARRKAQAIDKALNPPLVGPAALRSTKTSLLPGDITYIDQREGMQGLRPIHEIRLEGIQHLSIDIQETQYRVRRAFYEDLFLMLAASGQQGAQPVTAREIEERHEEKLLALGPVLERTNDELLDPLVDRVFTVMVGSGLVPDAPEELHGLDLKVEYLSVMAAAQKLVGVVGQDRFVQSTMGMVAVFPEVRHKVNVFQLVDDYADMLGINPKLVRTNEDATASLEAEQQAIARQAQAEQAKTMAQAGQALGRTPLGGDTALDAVLEQGAA